MSHADHNEALAREREALLRAYREVFDEHPSGRIVLADLLREGGLLSISFEAGDPYRTAWNDGRRSIALTVIERLRWSEMQLLQLARQHEEPAFSPISPEAGQNTIVDDDDQIPMEFV